MTSTQLLIVVLASTAGATVKSVTGMGYPVIAVPIIAMVLGVQDAVMVVAIPNAAANIYMCWEARDGRPDARDMGRLLGFGALGAAAGTIALVHLPEDPLMLILAATIIMFVVLFTKNPELKLDETTTRRWAPAVGFAAGCMQGAIGVSAPVVATWMHGYRLRVRAYIYSVTLIFGVIGVVQLVILLVQGQMTADRAVAMACASVSVGVVIPIGVRLRDKLAGETFERLVLAAIVLSAVALIGQVVF